MAKKKGHKSEAIRELLTANRKMPVNEIVSTLDTKGIKVKPNLVYLIRAKMGARRRKAVRRKFESAAGKGDAVALVRHVKQVAAEAGGIGKLKQLVEALAE